MAMTKREIILKKWLIQTLKGQGYKTYAKILKELDVRIDERPNITAYMNPQTGEIALGSHVIGRNRQEFERVASVLTRHEILHGFLQHEKRMLDKLEKMHRDADDGFLDDLGDKSIKELLRDDLYLNPENQTPDGATYANYAGDFEISNRGYTKADKDIIRKINLNGAIVSGLVTEDMDPSWVDLPLEDLYDKVKEKFDKEKEQIKNQDYPVVGAFIDNNTFVDTNGVMYGVD